MKVSVIAIPHPNFPGLFLHGRRRDNKKWTIPGGGADSGESKKSCAIRELKEETGLSIKSLTLWGTRTYIKGGKKIEVSLFVGKCPDNLNLKVKQDPDDEMECFKFLNPLSHKDLHVPIDSNIMREYLNGK